MAIHHYFLSRFIHNGRFRKYKLTGIAHLLILALNTIILLALPVIITSCDLLDSFETKKSKVDLVWHKYYGEEMSAFNITTGRNIDIFNDHLFVNTSRKDDYSPVLMKFKLTDGEHVKTWDDRTNGGLDFVTRYYWGNYMVWVRHQEFLSVIDINSMEVVFEIPFEESLGTHFSYFENRMYLTPNQQTAGVYSK